MPASFEPFVQAPAERSFRPLGTPVDAPTAPPPPTPAVEAVAEPSEDVRKAFQAGYELGREELRSDVELIGESFVKSLQELASFRAKLRGRYERELLELALGVARKVVQQELAERPEIWLGMIRDPVR